MNEALLFFMQELNQEVLDQETKEMKGWENWSLSKVLGYTENILPFCRFWLLNWTFPSCLCQQLIPKLNFQSGMLYVLQLEAESSALFS